MTVKTYLASICQHMFANSQCASLHPRTYTKIQFYVGAGGSAAQLWQSGDAFKRLCREVSVPASLEDTTSASSSVRSTEILPGPPGVHP